VLLHGAMDNLEDIDRIAGHMAEGRTVFKIFANHVTQHNLHHRHVFPFRQINKILGVLPDTSRTQQGPVISAGKFPGPLKTTRSSIPSRPSRGSAMW